MRVRAWISSTALALSLALAACGGEMGDQNEGEHTGPGDGPVQAEPTSPGASGVPATSAGTSVSPDSATKQGHDGAR